MEAIATYLKNGHLPGSLHPSQEFVLRRSTSKQRQATRADEPKVSEETGFERPPKAPQTTARPQYLLRVPMQFPNHALWRAYTPHMPLRARDMGRRLARWVRVTMSQ